MVSHHDKMPHFGGQAKNSAAYFNQANITVDKNKLLDGAVSASEITKINYFIS